MPDRLAALCGSDFPHPCVRGGGDGLPPRAALAEPAAYHRQTNSARSCRHFWRRECTDQSLTPRALRHRSEPACQQQEEAMAGGRRIPQACLEQCLNLCGLTLLEPLVLV